MILTPIENYVQSPFHVVHSHLLIHLIFSPPQTLCVDGVFFGHVFTASELAATHNLAKEVCNLFVSVSVYFLLGFAFV